MPILHKYHYMSCPGAIKKFFLSFIIYISETRAISFKAVLCAFKEYSIKVNIGSLSIIS